jgi:hypothetical protein
LKSKGKVALSDNVPSNVEVLASVTDSTPSVLVAQKVAFKGALHGWAANGLPMLDLGNGYGLQIVADESDYRTIQLHKYAINQQPRQQTFIRTKTKIIKEVKKQKPKPVEIKLGKVEEEVLL